jgi:hypothetical protein
MASLKITAAQKKLLTATELTRLKKALEPHTDVTRLIQDLRALRTYRQKQRDNLGKQVRAIKVGAQQTRALEANTRTHQKEVLFDEAVKVLESRLSDLRDQAQAHCSAPKSKKASQALAPSLLERALEVIEQDATSLFESNSLNGKLVDSNGVAEELAGLNGLAADIRAYLRRKA